jgi:hypothetical protein
LAQATQQNKIKGPGGYAVAVGLYGALSSLRRHRIIPWPASCHNSGPVLGDVILALDELPLAPCPLNSKLISNISNIDFSRFAGDTAALNINIYKYSHFQIIVK